ncbi:PNPOx family protein [Parerythrobacter aestuarii]|uniref:pyridoxamine 5'-phosphate oxidase family protein n=1 Tax=Parerythrobacter aestuarii TaxID=3020909 RepID=UPI0024DE0917|nr:pyridoxamine 5'-phosphate oxidase family protein [Parerythrobacter aestuarii]
MLAPPQSLEDIRRDIQQRLTRATNDRKSPMHTPVVATADADLRVMVLRAFDADSMTLRFHTDIRAPKAQLIGSGSPVGVLFYDKGAKIQVRTRGRGRIEQNGPVVDAAWAQNTNFARRCYLGDGPGAASDTATSGLPSGLEGVQPSDEQVLPARENFAVLLVQVEHCDWLYLAHTGHMRAQFDGQDARWVAP